ncbi:response regulator [Niastella populi]|uniref:Response regulatory domain-containing protein n=1 Tax=Niastella populi TaxID=550983 RepID=A0A1V9GA08_9BACT|nr:response regulator [Niastella populi]OQP67489.1 hypothetical protein A4R26_33370 [Niastella populi]
MAEKRTSNIILHVDDDPDDQFIFRYTINRIDPSFIIRQASNGHKAVEFLNLAAQCGGLPVLIIVDMNMPVITGVETFKLIKQDACLSAIPMVLFTTSLTDDAIHYCRQENIPAFEKPGNLQQFSDCVKKILVVAGL